MQFTASSTLFGVIGMISSFVILRWVAPEEMGLWSSLLLVQTYSTFVAVGGLQRS